MKLSDWCRKYERHSTYPTTERKAVSVLVDLYGLRRQNALDELYQLDDYKVSSVSGVVVWLLPIVEKTNGRDDKPFANDFDIGGEGG